MTDQENVVSRSAPTWSPDGTRLAWTEWNFPSLVIMVYDLEKGETRLHADEVSFGYADGSEYQLQEVDWGRYISKEVFTYLDESVGTQLSLYDDDGQRCAYQLDSHEGAGHSIDPEVPLLQFPARWVEYDGKWWIGLQYEGKPYRLMQPDTGEQWEADQTPTLQLADAAASRAAAGQRAALEANTDAALPERALRAVSPDGQYLAAQAFDMQEAQVTVWHDGELVIEITTPGDPDAPFHTTPGLAWARQTWQLSPDT